MEFDSDSRDQLVGGFGVLKLFKRLWPYFKPELPVCTVVIGLVIAHALLARGIVTVFGMAIDRGLIGKNMDFILKAAGIYLIIEITIMSLQFAINTWFAKIGNRVLHRLRDHLVQHVQSLPAEYFDRVPSGKIVTRLTSDTVSFTELFNQGLLSVFTNVVSITAILMAMLLISVKMTLLILIVAPPLVFVAFKLSEKILVAQRNSKRRVSAINAFVAESVSGMKIIQLFNRTSAQRDRFNRLSADYKTDLLKAVSLYALLFPTVSLFTGITVVTALAYGGSLAFDGAVTTGAMISFIFHVKDFGDPLRNILERYQLFQNSVSSGERIFSLLEEPPEVAPASSQHLPLKLRGDLSFSQVSFRYREDLPLALDAISFKLGAGKTLAVLGRTGSGKSTLISLLQRFRDPVQGEILIDGIDLKHVPRGEVRRIVGVVQQDVFLFRGTIADNISLADPEITRDRIEWAAKEAGLTRLLQMRPGGLEAHVEERGANLSIGERQLIAFARILAFDCEILVLDEATANVDSETEALLQEAARRARLNRTCVVIAHRLSTIADADHLLVLKNGRLIEQGAPQALAAQPQSHYRRMLERNPLTS